MELHKKKADVSMLANRNIGNLETSILAIVLFSVTLVAGIALYHFDSHAFVYFGDAASHLVKAREFIDSQKPGLHNIGTVWLPLPHLLLLPFAVIDGLFFSELAGAFVGIPLLVGTGFFSFLILKRITNSKPISFFVTCVALLNPNIVYMALTPMSEPALLFFVTMGACFFLDWLETDNARSLQFCVVGVVLASLCRYEAWPLVPFITAAAALRGISFWRQAKKNTAVRTFVIGGLCWAGIAFWFIWNYALYGNPFEFAHRTYSAGSVVARQAIHNNPQTALFLLGKALLVIFGPIVLCVSLLVFLSLRNLRAKRTRIFLLLFLIVPPVFTIAAILYGFVQIDQWTWNWRYVLSFGPLLMVSSGIGLSEIFRRVHSWFIRGPVVVSLAAMLFIQIGIPSVGVATFKEASAIFKHGPQYAASLGERLHAEYKGGSIALLAGYGQGQRIMLESGIPLKKYHLISDTGEEDILSSLDDAEEYLVIGKDRMPESQQLVDYWLAHREMLLHFYDVLSEDDHFILMEHKHAGASLIN